MKRKKEEKTISIPIRATYTYDRKTGELIDKELEFADIPGKAIAEFFLARFGIDAEAVKTDGEAGEA